MQSRTTTPTITSQRLRLGSAAAGESSLGNQEQRGEVGEQARAAHEREHDRRRSGR